MLRHLRHPALTGLRPFTRAIGSIVAVRTSEPVVVLTYDDGPQPGGTDRVLAALEKHAATATFFVLMGRVRRHPGMVRQILEAGHEVALHGEDHRRLPLFRAAEVRERTRSARDELEQLTGAAVRWVRPPYGHQRFRDWRAVREAGVEPVLWSASTRDSAHLPDEQRLASALRSRPGTILLAHDGYAGPGDGVDDGPEPPLDRGALTDGILTAYAERGWRGSSLRDALRTGTPVREAWFSR